ncbi:MAG: hypothetical protein K2X48_00290 [Chitinophagaceae bacterium]|nr:hypothetical protein [Chitinophagaceae bacterium]
MCFSAVASFSASAILLVAGVAALKKVNAPSQILFASIPLLFSIQQFTEGFVWLSLTNGDYTLWRDFATKLFLVFAQVVWPVLVPFSMVLMERDEGRKKILLALTVMGSVLAAYLAVCLFIFPVQATIHSGHIHYQLNFPIALTWISGVFYFLPTVLPSFVSGVKRMPLLGIVILVSYLVTKFYFAEDIISVWCYFAAVASVVVLLILTRMDAL